MARRQLKAAGWVMERHPLMEIVEPAIVGECWVRHHDTVDWCYIIEPRKPNGMFQALLYAWHREKPLYYDDLDIDLYETETGQYFHECARLEHSPTFGPAVALALQILPSHIAKVEYLLGKPAIDRSEPEPAPEPEQPRTPSVSRFSATSDFDPGGRFDPARASEDGGPVGEADEGGAVESSRDTSTDYVGAEDKDNGEISSNLTGISNPTFQLRQHGPDQDQDAGRDDPQYGDITP